MDDQHPRRVEDYTTVSLVMILVNLLWIFGVIWAQFGLLVVILTGWGLNHGIARLAQYRASREIRWPSDA
ncbi:histidinol phosphate aminotransferase [Marivita sp.]|uniref:histidinol phosphate aminotransferase n=1 Tax=Marivita sp. TaxID=2003365 RepID=UPI003F7011D2